LNSQIMYGILYPLRWIHIPMIMLALYMLFALIWKATSFIIDHGCMQAGLYIFECVVPQDPAKYLQDLDREMLMTRIAVNEWMINMARSLDNLSELFPYKDYWPKYIGFLVFRALSMDQHGKDDDDDDDEEEEM
jgi:hypothetical protein